MSQTTVWLFYILLNVAFLLGINSYSTNQFNQNDFDRKSELEFVHVIWRHGDRSPIQQNPGDPYDLSYWPDGWGQLTNLGKQQHYELGKWLRCRYDDFLCQLYSADDIYIQSSDVDRTLMSAESNLAGLYKPQGQQIWSTELRWQPIPVHTKPVDTDYLIAGGVPSSCSSYQKAYAKYLQSPDVQNKIRKAKPFFDQVSVGMNATVNDLMTLLLVRDSWLCETVHNLRIPKWASRLFQNKDFYNAAMAGYTLFNGTPYLAKYFTGFLLKDILDRLSSKIAKTLVPDRKFWVYSSHDSTVFGFLSSLGMSDNKFAGYTATIILELRSYKNEHYVQIFYKNIDEPVKLMKIPGCGVACPLKKMYEIYDTIIPKNSFADECLIDE